ncbi:MAG: BrnA antitoxin family protein [Acidobacteria bacterium]|nr:BrnA antitoxin family protein [Acidobacteriota bacterium]
MRNRRSTTTNKTDKLPDYIVSDEDHKADLASGLTEDEVMKPGTYKARRSPWAERLKNSKKVKVSIYLDSEVVEYFRGRAEQPNAAPYQTQINNELRKVMGNRSADAPTVERDVLNDKKFLKALKKKLETV